MKRKTITTNDGSSSMFVPELNENYHSVHGAIQESRHVFIKKGLDTRLTMQPIRILEVGFGTGLNALLTLQKCTQDEIFVKYVGIEKYPITLQEVGTLNHGKLLKMEQELLTLHNYEWGETHLFNSFCSVKKLKHDLLKEELCGCFDLVYFDAFAPNKQQEMWSKKVFNKIHQSMSSGGLLVTYCCQGQVKRTLQDVGFVVEKTDGPPGKREMLTAIKK
jgi:tRNA U34 5-methylaminomethyl-2-thiouridine-forming methyltransferase MnmC